MSGYIINVKKSDFPIRNMDKIGGSPSFMPPNPEKIVFNFVMELYNHGIADEDIICWQFYQGETGGAFQQVVEIHKGAEEYKEGTVKLRRWLEEYEIQLTPQKEEEKGQPLNILLGEPEKEVVDFCKENKYMFVMAINNDLVPYGDLNLGYDRMILALNQKGKMVIE